MKITEEVRKYAAERGIAAEEALERGLEEKSSESIEKGAEVYAQTEEKAGRRMGRGVMVT